MKARIDIVKESPTLKIINSIALKLTLNLAETQSSTKLAQAHRRSIKTLVTPQIEEML